MTKICKRCGSEKPLEEFSPDKSGGQGRAPWCRPCFAAYMRETRRANPEKFREQYRKWNQNRSEASRARSRERCAEWRKSTENRARMNACSREHYRKHREHYLEQMKDWAARHPEASREIKRRWNAANRESLRLRTQLRRARLATSEGCFTEKEWRELCARYDHRCLCCGMWEPLTVDHVVPVSMGGSSYIENIQPLCGPCNSRKGAKAIDYRPLIQN